VKKENYLEYDILRTDENPVHRLRNASSDNNNDSDGEALKL